MRSYLCLISAATCALLVATEGAFAGTPCPARSLPLVHPRCWSSVARSWPFAIFVRGANKFGQALSVPGRFGAIWCLSS